MSESATRTADAAAWQPVQHAADNWLDEVPGTHRIFFDTVTPEGFGDAVFYANNYLDASARSDGIDAASLAVVICARHHSTAFAYSDAVWAKYGMSLAERDHFTDPRTSKPPVVNVYQASGYGALLRNNGVTLDTILKRGVRLAVCQLATRGRSALIARLSGFGTALPRSTCSGPCAISSQTLISCSRTFIFTRKAPDETIGRQSHSPVCLHLRDGGRF